MLILNDQVYSLPVVSLQTGRPVAQISAPIIEPSSLKVLGFYCAVPGRRDVLVLPCDDIRQFNLQATIIDHEEELVPLDDIVRLKKIAERDFTLDHKLVVTESRQKLGKVIGYIFDSNNYLISKLHVKPPLFKSMATDNLVIARSAIVDVTDRLVVVRDGAVKVRKRKLTSAALPLVAPSPKLPSTDTTTKN